MKVLVCGSRRFSNDALARKWIEAYMRQLVPKGSTVIHGGASGADTMAAEASLELGLVRRLQVGGPVPEDGWIAVAFLPDWKKYGKRAGFVRNDEMLDQKPDLVIAFWNGKSKGTKYTIDKAQGRGIETKVIEIP